MLWKPSALSGLTLTLKMKEDLHPEPKFNCFIFNRQHVVQKSLMTFLGLFPTLATSQF